LARTRTQPDLRESDESVGESAVWVGSAISPLMLVIATIAVVATVILAATGTGVIPTVIVGFLVAASTIAFGSVHVAIDEREVRVKSWLGIPRKTISMANVTGAHAVETSFTQWGGVGYRVGPRGVGFIVRSGPAIEVHTGDSVFTVTVDRADEGAAVAAAAVARRRQDF